MQNYHKSGEKPTARSTHHVARLLLYLVEKLKIYEYLNLPTVHSVIIRLDSDSLFVCFLFFLLDLSSHLLLNKQRDRPWQVFSVEMRKEFEKE